MLWIIISEFFSAGSEWWENSTPSGLVEVKQPKKMTGLHYYAAMPVSIIEILSLDVCCLGSDEPRGGGVLALGNVPDP
jgi:hypothetical protein